MPPTLSSHQAQYCAAILMAGEAGHPAYAEAADTVARFLQTLALDLLPGIGRTPVGSAALWQALDELPWPAPGPPTDQPS